MLKNAEVYHVTIMLNDGKEFNCLLLSKPDAATLVAIAEAKEVPSVVEAVTFAHNIAVPDAGVAEPIASDIVVAGTVIGTVNVSTLVAYIVPPKRGRKPKPAEETSTQTTD